MFPDGECQDKELFYSDNRVRAAYRAYVAMLLARTNTLTGVRYRDDPAILAFEVCALLYLPPSWSLRGGQA